MTGHLIFGCCKSLCCNYLTVSFRSAHCFIDIYFVGTGARFNERRLLLFVLDFVRNSVMLSDNNNEIKRLPSIVTMFLSHTVVLMLKVSFYIFS